MIIESRQKLNTMNDGFHAMLGDKKKGVKHCKTLGVVDDRLLWSNHVAHLSSKVSKGLGVLRRVIKFSFN